MELSAETLKAVYDATFYVTLQLAKALTAALRRDSDFYWPFLVSSVILAALVWRWTIYARASLEQRSWRGFFGEYFTKRIWWHPSARADYAIYFANALVLPLVFGYLLANERQVAQWLGTNFGGGSAALGDPGIALKFAFTLAFFVAYDFGRFVAHSLLHDVPLLWEFHKVHHSAEVLTPITGARAHPIDLLVMAWVPAMTTGLVVWTFNRYAGGAIDFYKFLGVHAIIWAFNLIGNLRHSPVWLSYGPVVGKWLISPAHHQLHHSYEPRHLGCNRGFELAIWDRMYGTLYVPPVHAEAFRMGLGDATDGQFHTLARMYLWPFAGAARRALKRSPAGRAVP